MKEQPEKYCYCYSGFLQLQILSQDKKTDDVVPGKKKQKLVALVSSLDFLLYCYYYCLSLKKELQSRHEV